MKEKKAWVIVEMSTINGEETFKTLAETEDRKAINTALSALKLYKDDKIKYNELDLTEIRTSVVEELSPINQILETEDSDVDRLMSLVDSE